MDNLMNNIKNNKNAIMICIILILIIVLISLFINNNEYFNKTEIERVEYIKKYEANEFVPVYVTNSDMANKYLNDYKNIIMNDVKEAYNLLNKEYKEKKYGSFENFNEHINDILSVSFYNMTVSEYSVSSNNGYKFFHITASNGDTYIFKEISIMNYEVFLDNYTVELK